MIYDLWDLKTGNLINTYATEAEALIAVSQLLAVNKPDYVRALSLGYEDDDDEGIIAEGAELAERARAAGLSPRSA